MEFEQALQNEILKIRARLEELMALDGSTLRRRTGRPRKARPAPRARRQKPFSAARRKQMSEHGVYLGVTRNLSTTNKARVKNLRATKGVSAAIREAKRLGSGKATRTRSVRQKKVATHQKVVPST